MGTRVGSGVSLVDARAMLLSDGSRQGHWRDLVACSGLHGLLFFIYYFLDKVCCFFDYSFSAPAALEKKKVRTAAVVWMLG